MRLHEQDEDQAEQSDLHDPHVPESIILPEEPEEDDVEEKFVRQYRLVDPEFDWDGHRKHAPRDDEVIGDRYEPRTDEEKISLLTTVLDRFPKRLPTAGEELDIDEAEDSESEA